MPKSIIFPILLLLSNIAFAQNNDGPIEIQVKLREVKTIFDATDVGQNSTIASLATPDELSYILWARDDLGGAWIGGTCFTNDFTPAYNSGNGTLSADFDSVFATLSYPTLVNPQFVDIKLDAWEDDNNSDAFTALSFIGITANTLGTRNLWDDYACQVYIPPVIIFGVTIIPGFCLYSDGDDYRCLADPFKSGLDYRLGNPCEWYNHGNIQGDPTACVNASSDPSAVNSNGYYEPYIDTYWRYTDGTSFTNSINLGLLPASPTSLQHFNSNKCYNNYYAASPGNDVIYSFDIANPTGVNISLCGINGATFDSYLYLVSDTVTGTPIDMNDNFCGGQSQISTSLCTPGTYYVVVDATAAIEFGTFTLEITEDPLNTFSVVDSISDYNGEQISCNGGADGKFYAHVNGGTPPYTYAWTGPNGFTATTYHDSITGLSAGNYSVIVTDSNWCVLPPLSVTLIDPTLILVTATPTAVSCNAYSDGIITVLNTSGGTPSYSYSWTNAAGTFVGLGSAVSGLSAGTYTLTVTDDNGCFITYQDIVPEPAAPSMSVTSSNPLISSNPLTYEVCDGNNITLTASFGFASYSWSPNIWLNAILGPTVIALPSGNMQYICTGTDLFGCTTDVIIDVNVVSSVVMYVNPPLSQVCEGEDIEVTWYGAPGTNFSWFPPTYLSSASAIAGQPITINPQDTITYTITAQNSSGCIDQATYFIDILPAPNINTISPVTAICYDSSVPITASGGANSYIWSPSSSLNVGIGNVVTASPIISTEYRVVGTALNGCKDSSDITISVNPLPVLSVTGTNNICEGESTPLLVSGADLYIWTPSTSLNTAVGNTVLATPSASQTYTIVGTDLNQCEGTTSYSVLVLPTPNISITPPADTICIGGLSSFTAIGGDIYSWTPSSSLNTNTGSVVSAIPSTTTTYSVLGTNANNCSSTSLITVNVNPLPILNVTPNISTICEGKSVGITASGAQDFIWSPALGLNTTQDPSVIANPITTTVYSILGTDANDCSDIISATVNVNPKPTITLSPSSADICEGASININAFGALSYSWIPSFGLNSTIGQSVIANPTTSTSYIVTGTDINSCTNTANFQLNVGVNPSVSITADTLIICEGRSVALLADGANQYVWTPSNTLSSGVGTMVTATPLISTEYFLVGTDSLGCEGSISTTISVNPLPTAFIAEDSLKICTGDMGAIPVEISGTPPWELSYSVNGALQENILNITSDPIIISSNIAGEHTLITITDGNGCTNIGNGLLFLDVLNTPIADFLIYGPDGSLEIDILQPDVSFINTSFGATTYSWYFGDPPYHGTSTLTETDYTYRFPGRYEVTLVAMNGPCIDDTTHDLIIKPVYTFYIPNAFSPNNDGHNDYFPWDCDEPKAKSVKNFDIYIYNAWGEEVFHSQDQNDCWNGKMQNDGRIVAGYYAYVIQILDELGVDHTVKGKVLLN